MLFRFHAFACLLFCLASLNFNCGDSTGSVSDVPNTTNDNHEPGFVLDARNRKVSQRLAEDLRNAESYKFVETELVKIQNPRQLAIRFEVHYAGAGDDEILLGTFSPFPADNPGRFIVPTQGKLRAGGTLTLTLVLPSDADGSAVRVEAHRLKLVR